MINILYVIESMRMGGAENLVSQLAAGLDKRDFNVKVCSLSGGDGIMEMLEKNSIPYVILDKKNGRDFSLSCKIRRLIRQWNIHIVHTHCAGPLFYTYIATRFCKVTFIHTEHTNLDLEASYSAASRFINRIIMRSLDGFVSIAEHLTTYFRGLNISNIVTIPNGVNPDLFRIQGNAIHDNNSRHANPSCDNSAAVYNNSRYANPSCDDPAAVYYNSRYANLSCDNPAAVYYNFRRSLGLEKDALLIGCIAVLRKQKDHATLIRAMQRVITRLPEARLVIAGDGESRSELERMVKDMYLDNVIFFLGYRTDVSQILSGLDVFVLTSRYEGIPLSLLEAQAAGVPVVATNVCGNNEVIEHGRNGLLVPPGDDEKLAQGLIYVLTSPDLARTMVKNGMNMVNQVYNLRVVLKKYEKYYIERMAGK